MRTRIIKWLDIGHKRVMHGIDVWFDGRWMHAFEGDKPLLFKTYAQAVKKRTAIRRKLARENID